MDREYYEHLNQCDRQRQQEQIRREILEDKEEIDTHSYRYHREIAESETASLALERLIDTHRDLASATLPIKVGYILILFIPLCAYLINILLIYRPTEYLVEQSLGINPIANFAKYIVPLVIVLFEMGLATTIYTVIDKNYRPSKLTIEMMVLVTPTMLLATNLALYSAENRSPQLYELLLLVALLFLAYISDATIVKGYRIIERAISYVWFSFSLRELKQTSKSCHSQSDREFQLAGRAYDRYSQNLEDYNRTYPEAPIQPLSFDSRVGDVIAKWLAAKKAANR
jgi:hypothetical protein